MKKVLFIAVAALAFAACGNSSNTEEQAVETITATEVAATPADTTGCCGSCTDSTKACATDSTVVTK